MFHLTENVPIGDNVPAGPVEEQHNTNNGFQDQTPTRTTHIVRRIQLTRRWRHHDNTRRRHPTIRAYLSRTGTGAGMLTSSQRTPGTGSTGGTVPGDTFYGSPHILNLL